MSRLIGSPPVVHFKFESALQSMCMVRSPKSIGGAVGAILGNAPYGDCDRTKSTSPTKEYSFN